MFKIFRIALVVLTYNINAQHIISPHSINSIFDEQYPVMDEKNGILYFTRSRHPGNYGGKVDKGDIWYSIRSGNSWSPPENVKVLNNASINSVIGINSDGGLLLYGHYSASGPVKTQGIAISYFKNGSLTKPVNIAIPYFKNTSEIVGGSLAPSGDALLLAMESYNTRGTEDIYVCLKRGDSWSEPRNVGGTINTRYQEFDPSINSTLDTLYFSSNGHSGMGSADVFMSVRKGESWTEWSDPIPLEAINTSGQERGYRKYDSYSVFTSTQNSDGFGDIRFYLESSSDSLLKENNRQDSISVSLTEVDKDIIKADPKFFTLYGSINDQNSGDRIEGSISVLLEDKFEKEVTTNQAAKRYSLSLPSAGVYTIKVSSPNYITHQEQLEVFSSELKLLEKNFRLQKIEVGARVNLENVLFEQSKASIVASSYQELNSVVDLLRENPSMKIRLEGHTDNRGNTKQNLKLSKERVGAVRSYLVKRGISKKRVSGKGFGGSKPIADNSDPESRKLNRRVEFIILKD
ncbi:MAG: OmpA family protein [Bacteroidota bacterium]